MADSLSVKYTIRFNRFPQLMARIPQETASIRGMAVLQIHEGASIRVPRDTGNLAGNVDLNPAEGYVHWRAPYARYVNDGTRRMGARPFVDEAVAEVFPLFVKALERMAKAEGIR